MLLAIDTSTGTSVAVVDGAREILAEHVTLDTMRHAEVIGAAIAEVLDIAGIVPHDLEGVAAGMGPGPFTGLRVGIAAAQAFALGIGRPFIPVASHDAIAWHLFTAGERGHLQIVTDARRREFAVSEYDGLDADGLTIRTAGPALVPHDAVLVTSARRIDADRVPAGAVGLIAELAAAAGRLPIAPSEPLYLRAPDVTLSAAKRVTA